MVLANLKKSPPQNMLSECSILKPFCCIASQADLAPLDINPTTSFHAPTYQQQERLAYYLPKIREKAEKAGFVAQASTVIQLLGDFKP